MNINIVSLSGRVVRDPELTETPGGAVILKFTLANNRNYKKDDKWESIPQYFDCVVFGKMASSLSDRLKKASQIVISGSLHYDSWEDQTTGSKKSKISIYVANLDMFYTGGSSPVSDAVKTVDEIFGASPVFE